MRPYTLEREWTAKAGLRCAVVLQHNMGHRCGYVAVPRDNCLWGKLLSDPCGFLKLSDLKNKPVGKRSAVNLFLLPTADSAALSPSDYFDVHGSLTYSSKEAGGDYPVPTDDLWWFGFDCLHSTDACELGQIADYRLRKLVKVFSEMGTVKTLSYCVSECERLAEQIVAVTRIDIAHIPNRKRMET